MSPLNLIHLTVLRGLELHLYWKQHDPSISLLRVTALASTYLVITSFTFVVISSGGTITLATCDFGVDNFSPAFSINFLPASFSTVYRHQ